MEEKRKGGRGEGKSMIKMRNSKGGERTYMIRKEIGNREEKKKEKREEKEEKG